MTIFSYVAAAVGAFFIWTLGYAVGRSRQNPNASKQAYQAGDGDVR